VLNESRFQFMRPPRRESVVLAATGVVVFVVSAAVLGPRWWRLSLLGEWATYMLLAFVVLAWRPFRLAVARTGRRERIAVTAAFLLLALGQLIGGSRLTFPLVRFQMFTDATSSQTRQYYYLGISKTGDTTSIDPVELFPSLDRGRFEGRLQQTVEAAVEDGPGSDAAATYEGILSALIARYNLGAKDPLVRLEVRAVDLSLDPPPRDRVAVRGTLVWSVEATP
jgi:hypothetical protein